jgi:hypothetical protein
VSGKLFEWGGNMKACLFALTVSSLLSMSACGGGGSTKTTLITAPNQWTWASGSDLPNQPGIYGTQGTAASSNVPGAREQAVSWTDASGNFWLFGGSGYDSTGNPGTPLNDLWKYSAGEWTWMGGSSTTDQPGTYGTEGTPGSVNIPGARNYSATWVDASGNFWLFRGSTYSTVATSAFVNDLWKYQP